MSNPNRTKVFIGFGAVAIVLVAAVAMWPPNVSNDQASGAIGVVQKHHAPQIAAQDVILGDEQTRTRQAVLYGDYFKNAQQLQSLSAAFASKDAQAANIAKNSEELASQLKSQYASRMTSALNSIAAASKTSNTAEMAHQAEELASQLKNAEQLSAATMHQLTARFMNLAEMQSKQANRVEAANQELASALASSDDAQAASHFAAATAELSNLDLASVSLADQQEYFANIEAAASSLMNMNAANRLASAEALAHSADQLAHAALLNVGEQASSSVEMASALAEMESKVAQSRASSQEFASQLKSAEEQFAARTASSYQAELAAMNEFAASRAVFSQMMNRGAEALQASMFASNEEMNSKLFSQLANTEELAHAATVMSKSLQNEALANALSNESQLANLANKLANRQQ